MKSILEAIKLLHEHYFRARLALSGLGFVTLNESLYVYRETSRFERTRSRYELVYINLTPVSLYLYRIYMTNYFIMVRRIPEETLSSNTDVATRERNPLHDDGRDECLLRIKCALFIKRHVLRAQFTVITIIHKRFDYRCRVETGIQ